MPVFKVWAVQLLHDSQEIEAASAEDAASIAEAMYNNTGELDPQEVIDGAYGVVGVDAFEFNTRPFTAKPSSLESEIATELGLKCPCTCQ